MNALDVFLLLAIAIAVAGGVRAGLLARASTWVGLAVGIVLATRTVPFALDIVDQGGPVLRLMVGTGVLAVTVSLTAGVFSAIGIAMRRSIAATSLSTVDRVGGAFAGGVMVLAIVWFMIPAAADVPGTVSHQVRGSRIVATVDTVTPDAPDTLRALRQLVDTSRFPEVFADLSPTPEVGPPPDQIAVPAEVVEGATRATAHVRADGCGRRYEGSSFVIDRGLLITNAHVVAGAETVRVTFPGGEAHDAIVVVYDADRDIALLEVGGLQRPPLPLAPSARGDDIAVIGYPGGQLQPRVAPGRVEDHRRALGRDIYGRGHTERSVVFLAANLRQGDSGSPAVDVDGSVVGLMFAISPDRPGVAYALDLDEIRAALAAPRRPGETGDCM